MIDKHLEELINSHSDIVTVTSFLQYVLERERIEKKMKAAKIYEQELNEQGIIDGDFISMIKAAIKKEVENE
jgi:hypothetical protein